MTAQSQDEFGGLAAAAHQFEATNREAADLAAGLVDAQINWRPGPGRWSVGQCLMHLATSTDKALPAIDRAIAQARERGWRAAGPYRYGWFTRWMTGSMEPPPKRRMKTFGIFEPPAESLRHDEVLRALRESRDRLLDRVRQAGELDLKRPVVVSPVTRLFRLPLGGYFPFLAAHDRRHLWQARQVREASGFGA
ncbi:MAG: DinB family protein [Gemmatimonadales bacterium]